MFDRESLPVATSLHQHIFGAGHGAVNFIRPYFGLLGADRAWEDHTVLPGGRRQRQPGAGRAGRYRDDRLIGGVCNDGADQKEDFALHFFILAEFVMATSGIRAVVPMGRPVKAGWTGS